MIDYREYPEIKAMATVRVINFNDECEGVGLSLRRVANNGYNAFRLVKFNSNFDKASCVSALQDYMAVTNTERINNGYNHMLEDENILIVCQHAHGHQYAVPFDYYDERIADCVKELGFAYGRDSRETYAYCPPEDYYFWSAGTYHVMPGFREFVEGFFEAEEEFTLSGGRTVIRTPLEVY